MRVIQTMKNKNLQSKQKGTKTSKTTKLSKLSLNELNQVSGGWRPGESGDQNGSW